MKQFLAGAATAIALFGSYTLFATTEQHTGKTSPMGPTPINWNLNNYRLNLGAYFHGSTTPYYPNMGPFRIVHLKPTFEFKHEDFKIVCFSFVDQEIDGTISLLQVDINLKQQASENFLKMLKTNPNKELSFELGPYKVANFTPDENSIDEYKKSWTIKFDADVRNDPRPPDFGFSANGADIPKLMHLAAYLSPEEIPKGCGPSFDASNIVQWTELTEAFWGKTKRFL